MSDIKLTVEHFSVPTPEDEHNYFTGAVSSEPPAPRTPLAPGTYRVLAGQIYRILPGKPVRIGTLRAASGRQAASAV